MADNDKKWYHLSLCQNMPLNSFYDDYEQDALFAETMDSVCLSCPVRAICLKEGIENQEHGLWGAVFLVNGRMDKNRNQHKSEATWDTIRESITG